MSGATIHLKSERALERFVEEPAKAGPLAEVVASFDLVMKIAEDVAMRNAEMFSRILLLPPRTLTRRRKEGELSPIESDRLIRLYRVYQRALELHEGNQASAARWLNNPKQELAGKTPLEMLTTEAGAAEVLALIERIEEGVFT
jgi:putative toxin-antitoxin system antitoxin component (TIGR02293 family)